MTKDCHYFNRFTIESSNKKDTPDKVKELAEVDINNSPSNDSPLPIIKENNNNEKAI